MRVNLLPERLKPKKSGLQFSVSPGINNLIRVYLVVWVVLAAGLIFVWQKTSQIKSSLSKIELEWGQAAPLVEERDALIRRKQELSSFLALLEKDFKRQIVWSKKLSSLANLVPIEIWLKEFNFSVKDKSSWTIEVSAAVGYLKTDEEMLDKIDAFIERLKADVDFFEHFQRIVLVEINKTGGEKGNIMDFKLRILPAG